MQTPTGLLPETSAVPGAKQRTDALIGVVLAALLGTLIVFMTGFSHIEAVHNAAHDTRHSHGFPCH